MKRVTSFFLLVIMLSCLCACGQKAPTWQEQYDLGVRYLSEGNYEEAIIAFEAAIEIDPKRPEAYLNLAQIYWQIGDEEAAEEILQKGYEATNSEEIFELLQGEDKELRELKNVLYPDIKTISVPFTVDSVTIGTTMIDVPKSYYRNYAGYYSNLMNDGAYDTVYNGFWEETVDNPLGHDENEFGFFFSASSGGGPIEDSFINQRGLLCLGQLQIQDSAQAVLDFFRFSAEPISGQIDWELDNGGTLSYQCNDADNFSFTYSEAIGEKILSARCEVKSGVLYSVTIKAK